MVLFLTGECGRSCWYCPLSVERKGRDVMFANDRPVTTESDILDEIRKMDALGTSVTGGEPLLRMDRLLPVLGMIREACGAAHHIHLYTGLAPDAGTLRALSGLVNEIRLHPPPESWSTLPGSRYMDSIRIAKALGFSAGLEVPGLEGVGALQSVIGEIDFLNINELEWGETNADGMRSRGYTPLDRVQNAIRGSKDWASEICRNRKVNWCPSRYKDSVQLRKRLLRIAYRTRRGFEDITEDGTVVYGVLEPTESDRAFLAGRPDITFEAVEGRLETGWKELRKYAGLLSGKKYIVERYPSGGMIVEVMPL